MGVSFGLERKISQIWECISGSRIRSVPKYTTDDIKFARLTGTSTGVTSYSVTSTTGLWSFIDFRGHLSAVGAAGNLTITLNDGAGSMYDTSLQVEPLTTVTDVLWAYDKELILNPEDSIDIAWESPTTGSTVTFGFTATYKIL